MSKCSVCGEDRPCRCKLTPFATGGYLAPDAILPGLSASELRAGPAPTAGGGVHSTSRPCPVQVWFKFDNPPRTGKSRQLEEYLKKLGTFHMVRRPGEIKFIGKPGRGRSRAIPPKTED